jgi:hypothetical protein
VETAHIPHTDTSTVLLQFINSNYTVSYISSVKKCSTVIRQFLSQINYKSVFSHQLHTTVIHYTTFNKYHQITAYFQCPNLFQPLKESIIWDIRSSGPSKHIQHWVKKGSLFLHFCSTMSHFCNSVIKKECEHSNYLSDLILDAYRCP